MKVVAFATRRGADRHRFLILALLPVFTIVASVAPTTGQGRVAPDTLRAEDVREAIEEGSQYLLNRQDRTDGGWGDVADFRGGGTALVTLALINAGVPLDGAPMVRALGELSQTPAKEERSTYVVSLRIMCLVAAGEAGKRYRKLLEDDVSWLVDKQMRDSEHDGGWTYGGHRSGSADFSNSQFALLALHEAMMAGIDVPDDVWRRAHRYWKAIYNNEGSFGYNIGRGPSNGSMTCAGISSLLIIQEHMSRPEDYLDGQGGVACCRPETPEPMLETAWNWLVRGFRSNHNPTAYGISGGYYYYIYGLERANRLYGRRFVGEADWYREGAARLVSTQGLDGSWNGSDHFENVPEVATSFALLFLSKGLRPVLFGRYESGGEQSVLHPSGLHNLTRQLEVAWQQPMIWQSVDATTADLNDLRESPVLFLSGKEAIDLDDRQKRALKQYIESGKFVFAEACQGDGCGDQSEFDTSFRALMAELFPNSRLEALPPDHPVWTAQVKLQPDPGWPLLGLQACCRTSVIYCPRNLACYWQLDRPGLLRRCPPAVQQRVEYCRNIGNNVAAYATGRVLEQKLELEQLGDSVVAALPGRALVFPKVHLGGGDDDAASAWTNLLNAVANESALAIDSEKRFIDPVFEQLSDFPLVFAHGRQRFSLDQDQRDALRQYLVNGGFLMADSICSSRDYTDSFRRELAAIFPDSPLKPIPADHPLWNDGRYGYTLRSVTLRRPDARAPDGFRPEQTPPLLEGIELEGRLVVVFSPFDLSCALENTTVSHCEGYTRDDATRIGTNIILYRMRSD